MRLLLMIALLSGLASVQAASAEDGSSSSVEAVTPAADAADYRKAGFPACPDATMKCAVGQLLSDDLHRFKIYSSNDPKLNGKTAVLDSAINTATLGGQVILVQFLALAGKQLMSANILGAAPSPVELKTSPSPFVSNVTTSIDLSHWKVTLPLGKYDDISSAIEVTDLAGFSLPPYFDAQPDGITFSASTEGAHTTGSHYPRSELREMDGNGDEYDWTTTEGGTLAATLKVNSVPTVTHIVDGSMPAGIKAKVPGPGRIVVGQIHGPDDELCRLYYDRGVLYFNDDKSGLKQKEVSFVLRDSTGLATDIPLGQLFSYEITANQQQLVVNAVVEGRTYSASEPIGSFWVDQQLYFKAGAYVQVGYPGSSALEMGYGTGSVTFTSIALSHQ